MATRRRRRPRTLAVDLAVVQCAGGSGLASDLGRVRRHRLDGLAEDADRGVDIGLRRDQRRAEPDCLLAALEDDNPADTGEQMKNLGLSLAPATKFPGAGDEGVVITEVDPASDAADKGLKPGDVILEVAGVTVSSPADVAAGVKKAMDGAKADKDTVKVLMQVKSGDQTRFVALSLKKA